MTTRNIAEADVELKAMTPSDEEVSFIVGDLHLNLLVYILFILTAKKRF